MASGKVIFTAFVLMACLIAGSSASYHYDYDYPDNELRQPRATSNFTSNANSTCTSNQFVCASGDCVNANFKCDGDPDCNDGSDELGCTCSQNEFRCSSDGRCLRDYKKCNDRRDCEDGSDEFGCDENVLRRLTEVLDHAEYSALGAVSDKETRGAIENSTKYELFDAIQMVFQAVHVFRNSSLFDAADAAYSKVRSVYKTKERYVVSDEEKAQFNKEAGNVLDLANKFADEASKFVKKSSELEVDSSDKNYSAEIRMIYLQVKWSILWRYLSPASWDLGFLRSPWIGSGPGYSFGEGEFSDLEEQAKRDMLQAIDIIKEAFDKVLDTAMGRVGYTVYEVYKTASQCLFRPWRNGDGCSDEGLRALIPLVQDFSKNVNEAIDY